MLVIFVLLIVDICKKKKDEGMEVVEGFYDNDTHYENMKKIAYGFVGGMVCVLIIFCIYASKKRDDENTPMALIFFIVITVLLGIGDLLYLITIKNLVVGIISVIVIICLIIGLIIGGIFSYMNKEEP